jgi:hypothetical protein
MWRYRETMNHEQVAAAYIWETSEDYKSDKLCMFVKDGADCRAKLLVVTFDYDYDAIDLRPKQFMTSMENFTTTKILNLEATDAVNMFNNIKYSGFSAVDSLLRAVSSTVNVIRIPNTMLPAVKLIELDMFADMNILSDMRERFEAMCFHLVDLVYGDVVSRAYNSFYWYEEEQEIITALEQRFFPLRPLNINKFKADLIYKFYDVKSRHVHDIDLEEIYDLVDDEDIAKAKQLREATDADREFMKGAINWITSHLRDTLLAEQSTKQEGDS